MRRIYYSCDVHCVNDRPRSRAGRAPFHRAKMRGFRQGFRRDPFAGWEWDETAQQEIEDGVLIHFGLDEDGRCFDCCSCRSCRKWD